MKCTILSTPRIPPGRDAILSTQRFFDGGDVRKRFHFLQGKIGMHGHYVIMSSCHHVIMSSCHHVIMSSFRLRDGSITTFTRVVHVHASIPQCSTIFKNSGTLHSDNHFVIFWDGSINVIRDYREKMYQVTRKR